MFKAKILSDNEVLGTFLVFCPTFLFNVFFFFRAVQGPTYDVARHVECAMKATG